MTIDPFTLNNLYGQGIIDYVPYDLGITPSASYGMQNPYLQSAMQGQLYRTQGTVNDSFVKSAGMNGFGVSGYGNGYSAGMNGFGEQNIGHTASGGLNGFGEQGIGGESNAGVNGFGGGLGNLSADFSNGLEKTVSFFDRIPTFVKGLISGVIVVGTIAYCLKGKKKLPEPKTSFWTKMNPVNWFKHKK